jgi:aquaporin SIP
MGGIVKAVVGDAVVTFMWVFCVSCLGPTTAKVMSHLPPEVRVPATQLGVSLLILATLLFTFTALCEAMGGASFNPTGVAAFYAAGLGKDSLISMALRFPAQVLILISLLTSVLPNCKIRLSFPSSSISIVINTS